MMKIIVDIDGTIADNTHRAHHVEGDEKDWPAFFAGMALDTPILPLCELVKQLAQHNVIYFVTGRPAQYAVVTLQWIEEHIGKINFHLMMRQPNDYRPDYLIKKEILEEIGHVDLAIDDRQCVVDMWRSQGVPTLQYKLISGGSYSA